MKRSSEYKTRRNEVNIYTSPPVMACPITNSFLLIHSGLVIHSALSSIPVSSSIAALLPIPDSSSIPDASSFQAQQREVFPTNDKYKLCLCIYSSFYQGHGVARNRYCTTTPGSRLLHFCTPPLSPIFPVCYRQIYILSS